MKKNLTITITLLGIERVPFNAYVTALADCTHLLVNAPDGAPDGALMRIEENTPPSSAPASKAPASRSVLN